MKTKINQAVKHKLPEWFVAIQNNHEDGKTNKMKRRWETIVWENKGLYEIQDKMWLVKKIAILFQQFLVWWKTTIDHKFNKLCRENKFQIVDKAGRIFLYPSENHGEKRNLIGKFYYCDTDSWFYPNADKLQNIVLPYHMINIKTKSQNYGYKFAYKNMLHQENNIYKADMLVDKNWEMVKLKHIWWWNFEII